MSLSEAVVAHVDEIMESSALIPRNGFHLEPRCRVCRNDQLRTKVNDLLATGAKVCDAVKSTVSQEMWGEIIEKLEEFEQHQEALSVGRNSFDDADDEPFDPTEFIDDDDEF